MTHTLDQTQLKELLHYDPETGVFTWKVNKGRARTGDVLGCPRSPRSYLVCKINQRTYYNHRLAWLYVIGEWPKEIDHINGDKQDNRLHNLRVVTREGNTRNCPRLRTNMSGCTGVVRRKDCARWLVSIGDYYTGTYKYFGLFKSRQKAIAVRKAAEVVYGYHPNHGRTPCQMYRS